MEKNKMSENLIDKSLGQNTRPEGLPEKFYDESTGEIKLNELIADYIQLASKDDNLVDINNRNLPESFDKYDLKIPHPFLDKDEDVMKKFFEKGFTNEQAQLVYDLANERVIPVIEDLTVNFEAQKQLDKLTKYFGSQEKFNEISLQISKWAKQNLPAEVYDALATTSEGVIALHRMMSSNEPVISKDRMSEEALSEDKLKQMMQDPRYWREKDKDYVAQISNGFKKLYPEK
jgi:hypothetical protein